MLQADRDAVDERIQRIVQEEIQKAALAINEESRRKHAEESETSMTQSDSLIVDPVEGASETTKKTKKSIRLAIQSITHFRQLRKL